MSAIFGIFFNWTANLWPRNYGWHFGHQMQHITPESLHEKWPLKNSSDDLIITADAHIDNRDELFESLGVPHLELVRITHNTLILKAYEK